MFRELANKLGTLLLAFILAVIVWVVAVNEENPSQRKVFPEPIPIEFRNKPEKGANEKISG